MTTRRLNDNITPRTHQLPASASRLLTLPLELRQDVLRRALQSPKILEVEFDTGPCLWHSNNSGLNLSVGRAGFQDVQERRHSYATQVLRVCRQLHQEGCAILYNESTLHISVAAGVTYRCTGGNVLYADPWFYNRVVRWAPLAWRNVIISTTIESEEQPGQGRSGGRRLFSKLAALCTYLSQASSDPRNSKVNVKYIQTSRYRPTPRHYTPAAFDAFLSWMNPLQMLRCTNVVVTEEGVELRPTREPAWKRVLLGQSPVVDLFRMGVDFREQSTLSPNHDKDLFQALEEAVIQWNFDAFEEAKSAALDKASARAAALKAEIADLKN